MIHPEDRKRFEAILSQTEAPTAPATIRVTHKDGHTVYLQDYSVPIPGQDGHWLGLEGVARNISDYVRAQRAVSEQEATLRALVDNLPIRCWTLDAEGHYTMQNAAHRRQWGDMVGRTMQDLPVDADRRALWLAQFRQAVAGRFVEEEYETEREGRCRIFRKVLAPVREGDIVTGVAGAAFDVTGQLDLERQILEATAREQRRIGQDLHDNLGQHLTGVLCLSRGLANQLAQRHSAFAAQANEIANLIKESVTIARVLARGLRPVGVESGGLVAALEELALLTHRIYGIQCSFECSGPIPELNSDTAEHLYRIAQEAVGNAARHAHPSRIVITLGMENGKGLLRVHDNGKGLADQQDKAKGDGMGLRIMRHRARIINGSFFTQSQQRQNTTITCHF